MLELIPTLLRSPEDPYGGAPGPLDASRGKEIFLRGDGPLEAPAEKIEQGPFFKDVEERIADLAVDDKSVGGSTPSPGWGRREFLKFFGTTAVAGTAAGCLRRPVEHALPYAQMPEHQIAGVPSYYATTAGEGGLGYGIMVRTKSGRPIKVEGNPEHPMSMGATCALVQSSLQELYHPERKQNPQIRFVKNLADVNWTDALKHLADKLSGKTKVGIITGGATGHRHEFFREFLNGIGSSGDYLYSLDANALYASMAKAHEIAYNVNGLPRLDLSAAQLVVGVGSDWLDVGLSQVHNANEYGKLRTVRDGAMGRVVQFESTLSRSGGAADERHVIAPGSELGILLGLLRQLYSHPAAKGSTVTQERVKSVLDRHSSLIDAALRDSGLDNNVLNTVAGELLANSSVVLAGGSASFDGNATTLQLAAIMANELIGAYGNTLHLAEGWHPAPVQTNGVGRLMADIDSLEAVIVIEANPLFELPASLGLKDKLSKVETLVSMQSYPNEVCAMARYALNIHHYLESWGDEQPVAGLWSMRQPVVRRTTNSMQAEDALMHLAAHMGKPLGYKDYRSYLKSKWRSVYEYFGSPGQFENFLKEAQRKGVGPTTKFAVQSVGQMADVSNEFRAASTEGSGIRLLSFLDTRLMAGKGAARPVLQEVGDSMTSIAWDTWVAMSPKLARKLGVVRNDVVEVEGPGGKFQAAVYPMPGFHENAIAVPRGNGHGNGLGTVESGNGVDPLVAFGPGLDQATGMPVTAGQVVKVTKTGKRYRLAAMQKQNDIANRTDIVKKISLAQYNETMEKTRDLFDVPDLYPQLTKGQYQWRMSIDMTKCTGCSACMVACSIENNVPQVGREQILMGREMHWIRLDRYFSGDVENPDVTFQPMMCQQCNHAPCEAVCPVFATVHDDEGINTQTYNRCVGTRYCANACPYKVRRFNWWTHKWGKMGSEEIHRSPRAMNPDVTVRTRGIMEKCTFCIQRIKEARYNAKIQGRDNIIDGEVQTACQQVCPTGAISFGDSNDANATITKERQQYRAYTALNGDPDHGHYGIKTLPSVSYLAKIVHGEVKEHHSE